MIATFLAPLRCHAKWVMRCLILLTGGFLSVCSFQDTPPWTGPTTATTWWRGSGHSPRSDRRPGRVD